MITVVRTDKFVDWYERLRDPIARQRISIRIDRLAFGNPGDIKSIGDGVSELRIPYGPGYRLYCTWRNDALVLLLCGGNKSTQRRDIEEAKALKKAMGD
jgi:putative addiction module killer protein